ncbi:MAG: HU family DNA-binding protein [Bacteroidaceae bacterium]|nr:HU family DNA-binding protein [Bacteroidaceae bacterium]
MEKKINLSQLADLLAEAGGMSKTASEQFVKTFFDIISQSVLNDGQVKVKGLGTFKLLQMEDRESVNVNTGERFTIEGHQKISFTPDSELKERINKPFASFETVEITADQAAELAKMDEGIKVKEEKKEKPEKPEKPAPSVKDVTQNRGLRFLLKLLVWILSIVLVLLLALYLLWPLIGNRVLNYVEHNIRQRDKTELVTDSVNTVVQPVKEVAPVEKTKPVEKPKPVETVKPETKPQQTAKPVETPKPAATVPQTTQPAAKPETTGGTASEYKTVQLNSRDQAKDLKDFTEADTLNYAIVGEMAVHILKSGETITRLALKYYGTKKLWPYIIKYNNIKDSGKLQEGARIRIPELKAK